MDSSSVDDSSMTIHINDIPDWQKDSEFFMNLIEDGGDDEITISSRFIRENDTVCNLEDFVTVYEISTFFALKNPSYGLLLYLMKNMDTKTYEQMKKKYKFEGEVKKEEETKTVNISIFQFPMEAKTQETREQETQETRETREEEPKTEISLLWDIFDIVHYNGESKKLEASLLFAKKGNISMIEFYVQNGVQISYEHCIEASHSNRSCLEYCLSDQNLNSQQVSVCFENAIKSKKMDCLQYLFQLFPNAVNYENANYFSYFAGADNLEALIFLHQNGFPWDDTTCLASSYSLKCLQYLVDNGCPCDFRELLHSCGQTCFNYVLEKYNEQYNIANY